MAPERFFNTAGPVRPDIHYCLDPLVRIRAEEVLRLIEQQKYFVLHAPRQTGKTSCMIALANHLNRGDRYKCLYCNVEAAQAARENVEKGIEAVLEEIAAKAEYLLGDTYPRENKKEMLEGSGAYSALSRMLSLWAHVNDRYLVVIFDEIDSLVGDTLISVLRQLRSGYTQRPDHFPVSVILCGVRDVRDYRIHSDAEKSVITGGSAFNIKAESLRLGDFVREEMEGLYLQHTLETGQVFEPDSLDLAWELTQGQPWLVNALGYETCFRMEEGRGRGKVITADMMGQAKEAMILRRETHLDQLVDKLREERVRRVVGPILAGLEHGEGLRDEDVQYVLDLGLIRRERGGRLHMANAIYREVVPRHLSWDAQMGIMVEPAWYIDPDGRLNTKKLIQAFQDFFREHSESWLERFQYREAGPQLLMQAFLQRIVNSGGRVEREYGLGRMRTDLFVNRPFPGGVQKAVIELKVLHKTLDRTIADGLAQTRAYMDRCRASEGHLVIFDRTPDRPWEEKIFVRDVTEGGAPVTVWGM